MLPSIPLQQFQEIHDKSIGNPPEQRLSLLRESNSGADECLAGKADRELAMSRRIEKLFNWDPEEIPHFFVQ